MSSAGAAPRKPLLIHQLSPGRPASPALYVAESVGWTDEELLAVTRELFRYQVKKQWHTTAAPAVVYSFVKHDARSTKNIVMTESNESLGKLENQLTTNAIVHEFLGKKSEATFVVDTDGKFDGIVLMNPADLSGLRAFYSKAPMPPPEPETSS